MIKTADDSIGEMQVLSFQAFVEDSRAIIEPPFVSKFGALFLDKLDEPGPEHEWLIDGWLSVGDKNIIGGPSQSGKSFLSIHAGMCIAHGIEFFGAKVKQGLIVYQVGEGSRGVKKRLRAWRQYFKVEFSRKTPFVLLQKKVNLYGTEDTPLLIAEILAIAAMYDVPLAAIFIDTLATAAVGAEENSARDIGIVMNNIASINDATKAHVSLVHHMTAGADKLRGSTAIYANIDQSIFVKRDFTTNIRTASAGKQRDDDDGVTAIQFELWKVDLGVSKSGKPITSCVCLPIGEKDAIRKSEDLKGFSLDPKTQEEPFMRAFFAADAKFGKLVPSDAEGIPPYVRSIIAYDEIKKIFFDGLIDDEDESPIDGETQEAADKRKSERERKRRTRAAKDLGDARDVLMAGKVIGFAKVGPDWVCWWTGRAVRGFPETFATKVDPLSSGVEF